MKHKFIANKIKTDLKEKGVTQTEIAKICGISSVAVHQVVIGERRNPRVRKAISFAIGKPIDEIWPEK
jgi:lambda repressor-like predicted transcriptional regulator